MTFAYVAGSIGARQLQREAGEVDAALRRGATLIELEALLGPAERSLEALVAALRAALPREPEVTPPATADPDALQAAVERLEELLSQDAVEAIDAFDASAPLLTSAFGERASRIGALVKDYCFEEALVALREAAGRSPE